MILPAAFAKTFWQSKYLVNSLETILPLSYGHSEEKLGL